MQGICTGLLDVTLGLIHNWFENAKVAHKPYILDEEFRIFLTIGRVLQTPNSHEDLENIVPEFSVAIFEAWLHRAKNIALVLELSHQ